MINLYSSHAYVNSYTKFNEIRLFFYNCISLTLITLITVEVTVERNIQFQYRL